MGSRQNVKIIQAMMTGDGVGGSKWFSPYLNVSKYNSQVVVLGELSEIDSDGYLTTLKTL